MKNRFKLIRQHKDINMSQEAFGKRLGVTGAAISRIESGSRGPSEQIIIAVCREFNVNETWLRTGEGEMFVRREPQPLEALLVELLGKENVTEADRILMKNFLELSDASRQEVIAFVRRCAQELPAAGEDIRVPTSGQERTEPDIAAKVAAMEEESTRMEAAAEIAPSVTPLTEEEALARKAAEITRAQALSEKKPDAPASSAKESAAG